MEQSKSACEQALTGGFKGSAEGIEAMAIQERIVANHLRTVTIQSVSAYVVSAIFGALAFILIMYGPADKKLATSIFSAAFLLLAAGIAGFAQFKARTLGMSIEAQDRAKLATPAE